VIVFNITKINQIADQSTEFSVETMLEGQKQKLKVASDAMAIAIADRIKITANEDEREDIIRSMVENIRFESDNSGYFFVYRETKCIALPTKKENVGKDLGDVKDPNGVFFVRELAQQASKGGGFVTYVFDKPGKGLVNKLSYSTMIPGTNTWIGTGVYIDNISEARR